MAKTKCQELHGSLLVNRFGSKNILDARYLAVNRLARKCIKGHRDLIFRLRPGLRAPIRLKGSIIPGWERSLSYRFINRKKLVGP